MDFLNIDESALLQMASEMEFSHVTDVDDIFLSQIPMPESSDVDNSAEKNNGNGFGIFDLELLLNDAESAALEPQSQEPKCESRWAKPVADTDIENLLSNNKNKNTSKNTKWACNVFNAWRESREDNVPLILDMDHQQLVYWLSRFVCEARKQDGKEYPSKSLYFILCGLLRHMRDNGIYGYNFLDSKDARFAKLNKVIDSRLCQLVETGVDIETKSADPVLAEDEDKLWNLGVFGDKNAETLQLTVFFYCCKLFGLRGYDEHRSLQHEQFKLGEDERGKWIEFTGKTSKTHAGGLRSVRRDKKNIRHYCIDGPRCLADFFREYLDAINQGFLYRRPLAGLPIKYSLQNVGVNKIKSFMKTIATKGGLTGNYTNHSGKKTCATSLYDSHVDEQEIMNRTGHRSEMAVRKYKRATPQVIKRTSNALNPPPGESAKSEAEQVPAKKTVNRDRNVFSDITNMGATNFQLLTLCSFTFRRKVYLEYYFTWTYTIIENFDKCTD